MSKTIRVNKVSLMAITLIIVVLLIGFIIYWLFKPFNKRDDTQDIPEVLASMEKFADTEMIYPAIDKDNKNLFYFNISENKDLAFYSVDLKTKVEQQLSDPMSVPENIIWSPNRNKAILKVVNNKYIFEKTNSVFKDNSLLDKQKTTWLVDFKTKSLSRLNLNIQNIDWFDNERIIYNLYDSANNLNAIFLANADGSNEEKIQEIEYFEDVTLGPLSADEIYYFPNSYEFSGNNIYKINIKTKKPAEIISDQSAGSLLTTPSGKKIIYQTIYPKENKFILGIMNKDGSDKKQVNLETNINKIVLSEQEHYVVLSTQEENQTTDSFYKINLENLTKEKIQYISSIPINAQNLIITQDINIYFTSNEILYKMTLP